MDKMAVEADEDGQAEPEMVAIKKIDLQG